MIFPPQFAAKKKAEQEEPEEETQEVYYAQKKDELPRLVGFCGDLDEENIKILDEKVRVHLGKGISACMFAHAHNIILRKSW